MSTTSVSFAHTWIIPSLALAAEFSAIYMVMGLYLHRHQRWSRNGKEKEYQYLDILLITLKTGPIPAFRRNGAFPVNRHSETYEPLEKLNLPRPIEVP